jgi:hypothetical protein
MGGLVAVDAGGLEVEVLNGQLVADDEPANSRLGSVAVSTFGLGGAESGSQCSSVAQVGAGRNSTSLVRLRVYRRRRATMTPSRVGTIVER